MSALHDMENEPRLTVPANDAQRRLHAMRFGTIVPDPSGAGIRNTLLSSTTAPRSPLAPRPEPRWLWLGLWAAVFACGLVAGALIMLGVLLAVTR